MGLSFYPEHRQLTTYRTQGLADEAYKENSVERDLRSGIYRAGPEEV